MLATSAALILAAQVLVGSTWYQLDPFVRAAFLASRGSAIVSPPLLYENRSPSNSRGIVSHCTVHQRCFPARPHLRHSPGTPPHCRSRCSAAYSGCRSSTMPGCWHFDWVQTDSGSHSRSCSSSDPPF